jgi:hypothetical protein
MVLILVVLGAVAVAATTARWANAAIVLPSSEGVITGQRHAERPLVGAEPAKPGAADCAAFRAEFAALKNTLSETIGQPLECPHVDAATGDTLQRTSTGLAIFRRQSQTPTFTDGYHRWALSAGGVVTWQGDALDPPSEPR